MNNIITNSEKETFEFAKKYAQKLKGGEIIGLIGDLGAGKTVFAQGLAAGLGVNNNVTSPTFVIMKVYDVPKHKTIKKFCHTDAYRISNPRDIVAIGVEEYFNRSDAITIIEWAGKIKKILPQKTRLLSIIIEKNKRLIAEL